MGADITGWYVRLKINGDLRVCPEKNEKLKKLKPVVNVTKHFFWSLILIAKLARVCTL